MHCCQPCKLGQEEVQRRQERAERFQIEDEALKYVPVAPPEDEEKRKERAARFGTTYEAPDQSGQKDAGTFDRRSYFNLIMTAVTAIVTHATIEQSTSCMILGMRV